MVIKVFKYSCHRFLSSLTLQVFHAKLTAIWGGLLGRWLRGIECFIHAILLPRGEDILAATRKAEALKSASKPFHLGVYGGSQRKIWRNKVDPSNADTVAADENLL